MKKPKKEWKRELIDGLNNGNFKYMSSIHLMEVKKWFGWGGYRKVDVIHWYCVDIHPMDLNANGLMNLIDHLNYERLMYIRWIDDDRAKCLMESRTEEDVEALPPYDRYKAGEPKDRLTGNEKALKKTEEDIEWVKSYLIYKNRVLGELTEILN